MCCDKTKHSGWKDSEDGKTIYRTVDVSRCGFSVVATVLINLRGDAGTAEYASGTAAFSWVDNKTLKYTVWSLTNIKAYQADRNHWRAEWCLIGE